MKRAFSLIEAVVVVAVLGLAIPPSVMMLQDAANTRADAINAGRAASLAEGVMEFIVGDVSSTASGLGFEALADSETYLDHPASGLRVRLGEFLSGYEAMGHRLEVDISGLVSWSGASTGDLESDIFRVVTVRASYPLSSQPSGEVSITAIVSQMQ